MENEKITNMEMFLFMVGFCCLVLAIGYQNLILGGVAILAGFFVIVSIIKRTTMGLHE